MAWKNDQVSAEETEKILETARKCLAVRGDFVELGCYRGDTSLLLAEVLREYNSGLVENSVEKPAKKLWIYDSFEGLPEKNSKDLSELGKEFREGELMVTKKEVKQRFLRAGLPVPIIKKKWFNELTGEDVPSEVAFAFLDGDFYESIKDSIKAVADKMAENSVMIVHDYNNAALPGVMKAADEWRAASGKSIEIYKTMAVIHW